jgi:hypothetical protein
MCIKKCTRCNTSLEYVSCGVYCFKPIYVPPCYWCIKILNYNYNNTKTTQDGGSNHKIERGQH